MFNNTNRHLFLLIVLLIGVYAALQIPSNQKQALQAFAQPAISEAQQGFRYLFNQPIPTTTPAAAPTPFLTPTNLPIPPELVEAFNQQAAQFDIVFTDRRGQSVTNPNMPSYSPTGQGSAYEIPDETPPAETQFCTDTYGEWRKYPHAYAWCPLIVELFAEAGLSTSPISGVNNNLLTIDKFFSQSVQESAGDPQVVSYAGAAGWGQVMPSNGFIDLNYANSCDKNGKNCSGGKKNPPDSPEARQAYIDFWTICSNGVNKYVNQRHGNTCNNPRFQFANRPTVEELFTIRGNIRWQINHMNALTSKNGWNKALLTYYQGSFSSPAPEYTNPICSMLATNSDEACG